MNRVQPHTLGVHPQNARLTSPALRMYCRAP
jgi:hypothetical protein